MNDEIRDTIDRFSRKHKIDFGLLEAVVMVESNGNPWAMRNEPGYPWLYEVRKLAKETGCTVDTMLQGQSTSWGLMQVMGAVAYEYGFRGWPSELCKPEINLEYGCKHLKFKIERYGPKPNDIYAAYNAGSVRFMTQGVYVNQRAVTRFERIYNKIMS